MNRNITVQLHFWQAKVNDNSFNLMYMYKHWNDLSAEHWFDRKTLDSTFGQISQLYFSDIQAFKCVFSQ